MMSSRKHVTVALVLLTALSAGLWMLLRPNEPHTHHASPRSDSPSDATTPTDARSPSSNTAPAPQALIALLGRYTLSYRMQMRGAADTEFLLSGTLDVATLDAEAETLRTAKLSHLSSHTNGVPTDAADSALQAYALPFRIQLAVDGAVQDTSFAAQMPQTVRGVLLQVISAAQLPLATPDAKQWSHTERDANGTYEAKYQRSAVDRVRKQWSARDAMMGEQAIYGAEGDVTLSVGARAVEGIRGKITQRFRLAEDDSRNVLTTIEIELTRAPDPGSEMLASLQNTHAQQAAGGGYAPFDADAIEGISPEEEARQRVAGRDHPRILSDIVRAEEIGNWQLRKSFGFDLAALMRVDPNAVSQTLVAIGGESREPIRRTLIESLVNAGTPEGDRGLLRVIQDPSLPDEARHQARGASAFIDAPSPALLDQLDRDSRSRDSQVREGALLALASSLVHNQESGGASADQRLAEFIDRGARALDASGVLVAGSGARGRGTRPAHLNHREVAVWVQALGATGQSDALPLLRDASQFREVGIRAQAALSLGKFAARDASTLLIGLVNNDPDFMVRHHALVTIAELGPQHTLEATQHALRFDEEPAVRAEAAHAIGRWANDDPALRTVLQEALDQETAPVVIDAILDMTIPGRGMRPMNGPANTIRVGGR